MKTIKIKNLSAMYLIIFLINALSCNSFQERRISEFKGCNFNLEISKDKFNSKILITSNNKLKIIQPYYEELIDVHEGLLRASLNNKYGFIDKNGNIIIDFKFRIASDFHYGWFVFKDGKDFYSPMGYKDNNDKLLGNKLFEMAFIFYDGYALVKEDGKFGIINVNGKFLIKPKYDFLSPLHNGYAVFKRDEFQGIISEKGSEIIFKNPNIDIVSNPQISLRHGFIIISKFNKYGVMDTKFNIIIPPKFDYLGEFQNGFYRFKENKKWGYLDQKGNIAISPIYDVVYSFNDNLAYVEREKKSLIIDKYGKEFNFPDLEFKTNFENGINKVSKNKKFGLIDINNNWIIPPIFDNIGWIKENIITYKIGEKWGFIDATNCMIQ